MRGRILVKFCYFLLIFVNVVPVAITKHGTHINGHHTNRGNHNGLNTHENKHHSDESHSRHHAQTRDKNESDELIEKTSIQHHTAHHSSKHHSSAHHSSAHHSSTHHSSEHRSESHGIGEHKNDKWEQKSPTSEKHEHRDEQHEENNMEIKDKLNCKCDNILECKCDPAVADPKARGNFSCTCDDNKKLFSENNPINCNCLKMHVIEKSLLCQCTQNNGPNVNRHIECPEAIGYLIEEDERQIDFGGPNHTVHISDKSTQDGRMWLRGEVEIERELKFTTPTVPRYPDDVNIPTSTTKNSEITTVNDMDMDIITTTPIPLLPEPPGDNPAPVSNHTENPTPLPSPETPSFPEPSPNTEPPGEAPEPPSDTESPPFDAEPPPYDTEPLPYDTEEPPPYDTEPDTENPPIEPSIPERKPYTTSPPSTSKPLPSTPPPPPVVPTPVVPVAPPKDDHPKQPELNWGSVNSGYVFWTVIVDIGRKTEYTRILKIYQKLSVFKGITFYETVGTYVDGHIVCTKNIGMPCTKENRCPCLCVANKKGKTIYEKCFCNAHVLQPGIRYTGNVDIKQCHCYKTENKANPLTCDCEKAHSFNTTATNRVDLSTIQNIDISSILHYLGQYDLGNINICQCVFYNGLGTCNCRGETSWFTQEHPSDCLCFYKFENKNLFGTCYCVPEIHIITVKYNENDFVVQDCTCHNPVSSGNSLKCHCNIKHSVDNKDAHRGIAYNTVEIDLNQLERITHTTMLNNFLLFQEYRYEHFKLCQCNFENGKAHCNCAESVYLCTSHHPCTCFSIYQYEERNWNRMLMCNPHILESKFKFNEHTTEVDKCSCLHNGEFWLTCNCTTVFSTDSPNHIVDYNQVTLDLSDSEGINTTTLLQDFSHTREYHNEIFGLCGCTYLEDGFRCHCSEVLVCTQQSPCKCLCISNLHDGFLSLSCVCNSHVAEAKIDYNPEVFDLEVLTCVTYMQAFLRCDYERKEAVNYKFTTKSITEIYIKRYFGKQTHKNIFVNTTTIHVTRKTYPNGTIEVIPGGQSVTGTYTQGGTVTRVISGGQATNGQWQQTQSGTGTYTQGGTVTKVISGSQSGEWQQTQSGGSEMSHITSGGHYTNGGMKQVMRIVHPNGTIEEIPGGQSGTGTYTQGGYVTRQVISGGQPGEWQQMQSGGSEMSHITSGGHYTNGGMKQVMRIVHPNGTIEEIPGGQSGTGIYTQGGYVTRQVTSDGQPGEWQQMPSGHMSHIVSSGGMKQIATIRHPNKTIEKFASGAGQGHGMTSHSKF